MAGEFLDREIPAHELPFPNPSEAPWIGKTIVDRVDVRHIFPWFIGVLNPTLNFAASALKLDAGAELSFINVRGDEKVPNGWGELSSGIDGPKRTKFVADIVWDKTREWTYDKVRQRQGSAVELITPLSWLDGFSANYIFMVTPDHIVLYAKRWMRMVNTVNGG